ncbi:3-phytase B [Cyphellophora attinorum]|uniref:3-phytase n=1 Tax=Cyphellophora attinorum TaxID=1664694 RepID=A0A0N0NJP9_9EURO|nr:3-phytase B [Phialophora attinorum]KPI36909.1 3-phytase B [Phialophora attinorum]
MLRRLATAVLILSFGYILVDRVWLLLVSFQPSTINNGVHTGTTSSSGKWDLFYHLGGNGPWIPHHSGLGTIDDPLPSHCTVDQVHMISRHGERYPTRNAGNRHLQLLARLKGHTRPYAGTAQAERTGNKFRALYGHLIRPNSNGHHSPTRFWTCSSPRDIETAQHFANGFFGPTWATENLAHLEIIPEVASRGADTLTPGDTCLNYIADKVNGHDKGYAKLAAWQKVFTAPIARRLAGDVDGMELSPLDVYSMMELCGFETLVRGSSPWCDVFTREEWEDFEYGRDLLHFYRAGPGNEFSKVMGWLWLNATAELLSNKEDENAYFSFVHDGDIVPLLSALQILNEEGEQELPTDHVKRDRAWVTSDVVPMSGRMIFERIACSPADGGEKRRYVRMSINDGVVRLPGVPEVFLRGEAPNAVLLPFFTGFVAEKGEEYGDYKEVCGLDEDAPGKISFLHQ